uniref:Uncharacterized protein n=1 Tax=Chaetoceros debilis TaxID=122233 RepID=A0A6S8T1N1_9STRA
MTGISSKQPKLNGPILAILEADIMRFVPSLSWREGFEDGSSFSLLIDGANDGSILLEGSPSSVTIGFGEGSSEGEASTPPESTDDGFSLLLLIEGANDGSILEVSPTRSISVFSPPSSVMVVFGDGSSEEKVTTPLLSHT